MQALDFGSSAITLADRVAGDLPGFADGIGHPDFPCLSRAHNPSSCVPCVDFSPWLRERVRRGDADAAGEYLWRIRQANSCINVLEFEGAQARIRVLNETAHLAALALPDGAPGRRGGLRSRETW